MIGDSDTLTWGMLVAAGVAILVIFGTAFLAVNRLRKGNRRFRRWQFWRRADNGASDDTGAPGRDSG